MYYIQSTSLKICQPFSLNNKSQNFATCITNISQQETYESMKTKSKAKQIIDTISHSLEIICFNYGKKSIKKLELSKNLKHI